LSLSSTSIEHKLIIIS